ncbi:MAG: hypothetical protein K8R90_09485 [Candidatus Cloacimonetes bacterium]|nr:hypothetical protein [Candidatus Cloacimonadota bacterium]
MKRTRLLLLAVLLLLTLLQTSCIDYGTDPPYQNTAFFLMDTNGKNRQFLFDRWGHERVRVTADGQFVLYEDRDGNFTRYTVETGEIFIYDLPFDSFICNDVSFDTMYIQAETDGIFDVYAVDVETGAIENLTQLQSEVAFPYSMTQERDRLYYSGREDTLYILCRMDMTTHTVEQLASNSLTDYTNIALSRDCNALYYFYHPDPEGLYRLYRMDLSTQEAAYVMSSSLSRRIQVGLNEEFFLYGSSIVTFDENNEIQFHPFYSYDLHLMNNGVDIIVDNGTSIKKVNALTYASTLLSGGCNSWLSKEGNLIVFLSSYVKNGRNP